MLKRSAIAAAILISLSGCASVERYLGPGWEDRADSNPDDKFVLAEGAWQTLNVLDSMQTIHIANAPECYSEGNPVTRALVGEHPSKEKVIAVGIVYGLAHYGISKWLERKENEQGQTSGWRTLRITWHIAGLINKGFSTTRNHSLGLRPLGSECHR
jgi:hypothetical protein